MKRLTGWLPHSEYVNLLAQCNLTQTQFTCGGMAAWLRGNDYHILTSASGTACSQSVPSLAQSSKTSQFLFLLEYGNAMDKLGNLDPFNVYSFCYPSGSSRPFAECDFEDYPSSWAI